MKTFVLIFILCICMICPVSADTDFYEVIDLKDESLIASFESYTLAYDYFAQIKDAGIRYHDQLIAMDEGVVVLNHDSCTVNIDTIDLKTDENGYVNGCYGNDGLYLRTNDTGKWILMLQAGARVWVHRDDVTLHPYTEELLLSSYFVEDGTLYHQIRTRWNTDEYGSLIDLGIAPDELFEDEIYLSYDGHYFYDDFSLMSHDMKSEDDQHALNAKNPYYNYFMMLPHRTMSSYSLKDFEDYFQSMNVHSKPVIYVDQNKDSINDVLTRSQYANSLDSFLYSQAEFGSNALLMLALSMNESASGRSSLAYRRNNLFGHAAYDSDVESNAKRYLDAEASVISHAKNYISLSYANPGKFTYHGSFFGDKSSGMNVSYASDPYWSEKAAQYAFELDEKLGSKEINRQALAIVKDEAKIILYDETLEDNLTAIENVNLMSFVILDELEKYYLVQLDECIFGFNAQKGSYDFEKNVGYLKKSVVDIVLNPEKIHRDEYATVVFKALEGSFKDGTDTKMLQFQQGSEVLCETPVQLDAVFQSWIQVSEGVYEAQYRDIDRIEMHTMPTQIVELNELIDLSSASIKVFYADGSEEILPLTTSMVSGYDLSKAGEQNVTVSYGGSTCSYALTVSLHLDTVRKQILELMDEILKYDVSVQRTQEELQTLLDLKHLFQDEFYPVLTMNEITDLERVYDAAYSDVWSIIIEDNPFSLEASGFHLSKDYGSAINRLFFKDTLYISAQNTDVNSILMQTASSQGWTYEQSFSLNFKVNGQTSLWEGPILFSLDRPDHELKTWSVFYLDDEDVIQCHTAVYQNRIRFKALHPGEYLLVSKDSVNAYDSMAPVEVTLPSENGLDYLFLLQTGSAIAVLILIFMIGVVLNLKRKMKVKAH